MHCCLPSSTQSSIVYPSGPNPQMMERNQRRHGPFFAAISPPGTPPSRRRGPLHKEEPTLGKGRARISGSLT